jgi:hypothetical protein
MSCTTSQLETQQNEKISDKKTIIKLQQDLISKKNEELTETRRSVESGLKNILVSCATELYQSPVIEQYCCCS